MQTLSIIIHCMNADIGLKATSYSCEKVDWRQGLMRPGEPLRFLFEDDTSTASERSELMRKIFMKLRDAGARPTYGQDRYIETD